VIFLTDEHISPAVAEQAQTKFPGIKIVAIHDWRGGDFLGAADEDFLPEAVRDGFVFVTYDQKTIPPILKMWAETGLDHCGVVLVDHTTIPPQNIGGLVSALGNLWKVERSFDWTNRVVFLRPAKN
jgi:hypothetical protein